MVSAGDEREQSWRDWWRRPVGRRLLREEQELLAVVCARCPGQRVLLIGSGASCYLPAAQRLAHSIVLQSSAAAPGTLIGLAEALPLAAESVDLVVLHHALDQALRPRAVLRETLRVLRPGGHVIICGFNPWGLWRLLRWFGLGQPGPAGLSISVSHLGDWLELLDCALEDIDFAGFDPPQDHAAGYVWRLLTAALFRRRRALAAVYMVLARKRERRLLAPPRRPLVWGMAQPSWRDLHVHTCRPRRSLMSR